MRMTRLRLKVLEQHAPAYMVAECIGIKASRLSEYSHGRKQIPSRHLTQMAEWFNCEPHELLGWADDLSDDEAC